MSRSPIRWWLPIGLVIAFGVVQPADAQTAYYSLSADSGAQFEFQRAPRPLYSHTIHPTPPSGTDFPPLLIPRNPAKAVVAQTGGPDPKRITIPPGALRRPATGPRSVGVALFTPRLFQIRSHLEFSAPAPAFGSAVLEAGGRTGAAVTTFTGFPLHSRIRYTATAAQFGGPLRTRVVALSPVRVWLNALGAMLPCKHPGFGGADDECIAVLLDHSPAPTVAAGAPVGFVTSTYHGGPPPGWAALSIPSGVGSIAMSAPINGYPLSEMASSAGFPWTTGMVTLSQPSAWGGAEVFTITGMDSRVNGVGAISLVSGALVDRVTTSPAAERGWLRLTVPEPSAVVGALAVLGTLAVLHAVARRGSRD